MTERARPLWVLIGLVLVLGVAERIQSEVVLQRLTRTSRSSSRKWSPEERQALREVRTLWITRREQDQQKAARALVAYLSNPSVRIRRWAAMYLGRMEWPDAEAPLSRCLGELRARDDTSGNIAAHLRIALLPEEGLSAQDWADLGLMHGQRTLGTYPWTYRSQDPDSNVECTHEGRQHLRTFVKQNP
ncbi:MAG: hypothetical protein HY321_21490 [Armatimonadetes bacterium]|nr:hypothetical protein [Armatimonadota bacterium]